MIVFSVTEGPDRAISRCDPDAFLTNGDSSPEGACMHVCPHTLFILSAYLSLSFTVRP